MQYNPKKAILVVVSLVCLVVAVVMASKWLKPKDLYEGMENESYLVMCKNPKCNNTWQQGAKEFIQYERDNTIDPLHPAPQICPKCSEKQGYLACKCPKCEKFFIQGSVPSDLQDRCPYCQFSQTESKREAVKAARKKK